MDLASLQLFRAVAHEQSITRAAQMLGRAPSNVTTRIQQLEIEVGVSLFRRDSKRMVLTSEGQTYLDYAERILNLADEALQAVKPGDPSGTLRIGAMESTVAVRLPQAIAQFNADWPVVTLFLDTGPSQHLVDGLLEHLFDCALIAKPDRWWLEPDDLDLVPLFEEELVLLLPSWHPDVKSAEDIVPKGFATFMAGCTYRSVAEDWLTDNGRLPNRFAFHQVNSLHAMFACTAAGSCVSVMPRSVVQQLQPGGLVKEVPIGKSITYLASRPGFATPAFVAFREALVSTANVRLETDATA